MLFIMTSTEEYSNALDLRSSNVHDEMPSCPMRLTITADLLSPVYEYDILVAEDLTETKIRPLGGMSYFKKHHK